MKNAGKKFILSFAVILGFIGYVFRQRNGEDDVRAITANPTNTNQSSSVNSSTNTSTVIENANTSTAQTNLNTNTDTTGSTNTNTSMMNGGMMGQYKNGSYTGSVADAFYGNIQVRVTINGGKITDVAFLQYPNDRNTSVFINTQAMPLLKQEAIQAQSANVSGVSGASASSQAFVQSLQSALDLARV